MAMSGAFEGASNVSVDEAAGSRWRVVRSRVRQVSCVGLEAVLTCAAVICFGHVLRDVLGITTKVAETGAADVQPAVEKAGWVHLKEAAFSPWRRRWLELAGLRLS